MTKTYWIAGVLVIGLGAGVAGMAMAHRAGPEPVSFETLDANADGKVTQAEMDAHKTARFTKSDTNGDGKLSPEEMLATANTKAGARMERRVEKMIQRMDTDKDGMLSVTEMQGMSRGKDMFKHLDADNNGAISAEEFEAGKGRRGMRDGKHRGMDGERGGHMQHKWQRNNNPASE